uniref:Fibrillar collagen NC1 domain-containing protein n=2 Tax=Electrophorus electricus TaxID=8005 RepID=A0A4W4G0E5_ELEEL
MKFLHLLSTEATQTISLRCHSDPAVVATETPGPLRFQGWNGRVFEKDSKLQTQVLQDDCEVHDGSWQRSWFLLQTQDPAQLPVVAVQGLPPNSTGAWRHLEVGPVCFL